jgi:hypothetical protein
VLSTRPAVSASIIPLRITETCDQPAHMTRPQATATALTVSAMMKMMTAMAMPALAIHHLAPFVPNPRQSAAMLRHQRVRVY